MNTNNLYDTLKYLYSLPVKDQAYIAEALTNHVLNDERCTMRERNKMRLEACISCFMDEVEETTENT